MGCLQEAKIRTDDTFGIYDISFLVFVAACKIVNISYLQVKNFGRSGRTKYTHLVDQDTTQYDSAWTSETGQNLKFHSSKGGGLKQTFEKPAISRKK